MHSLTHTIYTCDFCKAGFLRKNGFYVTKCKHVFHKYCLDSVLYADLYSKTFKCPACTAINKKKTVKYLWS